MDDSFQPFFRNAHVSTIAGNFWRRHLDVRAFPVSAREFETEPGVRVLVHSQTPGEVCRGELILVHGLEGSSDAGYARSLAQAALEAGYAVHRFNMRSCGGTEAMCGRTLYHSGQTGDVLHVAKQLRAADSLPLFLVGFSLGGNVVLKLAGELRRDGQELLAGVVAVSTPIDLAACVKLLDKPSNVIYARRFLDRLRKRVRLKEKLQPGLFDLSRLPEVKSIYAFDDVYTAPAFGFGNAANYYRTQSARNFLNDIRIPTLVVQAKDDPLIPFAVYSEPAFASNPHLQLVATEHGGHLGFVSRGKPRFWLDGLIVRWLDGRLQQTAERRSDART